MNFCLIKMLSVSVSVQRPISEDDYINIFGLFSSFFFFFLRTELTVPGMMEEKLFINYTWDVHILMSLHYYKNYNYNPVQFNCIPISKIHYINLTNNYSNIIMYTCKYRLNQLHPFKHITSFIQVKSHRIFKDLFFNSSTLFKVKENVSSTFYTRSNLIMKS